MTNCDSNIFAVDVNLASTKGLQSICHRVSKVSKSISACEKHSIVVKLSIHVWHVAVQTSAAQVKKLGQYCLVHRKNILLELQSDKTREMFVYAEHW